MKQNKNIIIAPCGNKSNFFSDFWLNSIEVKEFDICILFYDNVILQKDRFKNVEYFYHLKDFKYKMIYELLINENPELLTKYEYFYFLDDDIEIDTFNINKIFQLSDFFNISIASASLTSNSFYSWKFFKNKKNSFCRFVGQIEVMSPLFSRESLITCLPTFIENNSSWGIELIWSKLLGYPKDKLVVFDCIQMKHASAVGKGELYKKINFTAELELANIMKKFEVDLNLIEYSRIIELGDTKNNILYILLKFYEKLKTCYSFVYKNFIYLFKK
jgi:hypothetical protein